MTQQQPNPVELRDLRTETLACTVDSEFDDLLSPLLQGGLPQNWPGFVEVKRSQVRQIMQGSVPAPDGGQLRLHLKLFRAVRLSDRARDALAGSRSMREFQNLRQARARGLPCVRPVATGTFRGSFGSRSFLLTLTEDGEPLPRGPLPRDDADRVGRLLRVAHDRGLHARDLHPGNLLRRPNGDVLLLDLTSAELANPLEPHQRARALAFFCLDLDGLVRDPAARPLLAAYGAGEDLEEPALRMGRRLRNRALSAFGRRAFRPCRHTTVEKAPRRPRWCLHRPEEALWPAARELVQGFKSMQPIKSGRRGAVFAKGELVAKRRNAGAAKRLFESAYLLLFAGVPSPTPVALMTFAGDGVAVSRRLPWPTIAEEISAQALTTEAAVAAARELGHAVGRLHSFGLRNRDLKFENLTRNPADNRVFILDLDGVSRNVPLDDRGRAADLGRLLAAFEDAGKPGGQAVLRAFLRDYAVACRQLQRSVRLRYIIRRTAVRASQWRSAHQTTRA